MSKKVETLVTKIHDTKHRLACLFDELIDQLVKDGDLPEESRSQVVKEYYAGSELIDQVINSITSADDTE